MDNSEYRVNLLKRTFNEPELCVALTNFKKSLKAEDWTMYIELLEEQIKKYYEADNKKDNVAAVVVKVTNEKKVFEEDFPVVPDYMLNECEILVYVGEEENQREIKLPSMNSEVTRISIANMQQKELAAV